MAHYDGPIVGTCMNCGMALREHSKHVEVRFSDGAAPASAYYCEDCAPFVQSNGKAKEEARVTLSDVPMMVARHCAALKSSSACMNRELVDALTRDYHAHLLSIAAVGNLPEQPTEGEDDRWISVKERLPEQGQFVLIWSEKMEEGDEVYVGSCWPATERDPEATIFNGMVWWENNGDYRYESRVTHWQPLPGKPKGLE